MKKNSIKMTSHEFVEDIIKNKTLNINKLAEHPLIVKLEFAKLLWPDVKPESANSKLNQKKSGRNYQRFIDSDIERAKLVIEQFINDIYE